MASHQRQHPSQSSQQHPHHRSNNPPNTAIRNPNLNHNGSTSSAMAAAAAAANGDGDLYQQLIDSNDLVKELDDIEAISQQISQHAEVLYQSWKQQEANKQHQNQSQYNYSQSNTLPSNSSRSSVTQLSSQATGSLPRVGGYQPGDFTKRATSPLKVQENGRTLNNGGVIPFNKQNGNHNPDIPHNMSHERNIPISNQPPFNNSPDAYKRQTSSPADLQNSSSPTVSGSNLQSSYQNIKRQTLGSNGTHPTNHNSLSSTASGLASPSFISSASNAASQRSNTLPGSARLQPVSQQNFPQSSNPSSTPLDPSYKSSTLPHSNVSHNNSNAISNNLLSEGNKSNPKSSETNVGRSLELLATPEVNGNLKDLVNSFVSTDRAKQAARQTISNTINNMSRRNGNGIRSTSPSSNTASSSPFSSRGVSPLRSPMLAAATNNPGPQAVLNSLHAISSTPPSTMSTSSLSSINTNLHNPTHGNPHPPGPLSPSASSTSSTSSSIDSQMNRSISTTSSTDPASNIHTKLTPMFSRTPSSNTSSIQLQKTPASPSWPSDQNTIPIPVQHIRTNDAGKATSSSTLMMTGLNNGNKGPINSNHLRSPRVLQNLTSSNAPTSHSSVGGDNQQKQLQPPVRQTSLEFNLQPPNLSSLHDQHIESMRQKFEEAKQRMNLLHERVRTGSDSGLISTRPPGLSLRSPFDGGDPFDVDSVDGGSEDPSNHSSYLFDQFRRRVARSKRETPSAPHPELTPQQRQHIFERTSSTGSLFPLNAGGAPNRRFPSGGSVAERVLIFERSPFAVEGRSLSTGNLAEKKKENVSNVPNWKSGQYDAQQKATVNRGSNNNTSHLSSSSLISSSSPKIRDIPILKADTAKPTSPTSSAAATSTLLTSHEKQGPTPFTTASVSSISTSSVARPVSPVLPQFKLGSLSTTSSTPTSTTVTTNSTTSAFNSTTTGTAQLGSRSNSASPASTLSRVSTPHTIQSASSRPASIIITGKEKVLPKFHFPYGNPVLNPYSDGNLPRFTEEFKKRKNTSVTLDELGDVLKTCGYPRSWKGVVFTAAGGDLNNSLQGNETKTLDDPSSNEGLTNNLNSLNQRNATSTISLSQFSELWRKMCQSNHDEASQFFFVVTKAADIASSFTSPSNENSDSPGSNSFSFLSKPSTEFSTSNSKQSSNFNSNGFSNGNNQFNDNNNTINNKKLLAIRNQPVRKYIAPEDLVILIQDVVDSHPGLGFLKEATEFHSRYVHTVIARIFYVVNRSWSGRLTISELRRSNFLSTLHLLDEEEDINAVTDFFSYEHFYVIYCKFWELDKDHDLFIDREDLARHNDHAISTRMIDRIFSGTVTHGAAQKEGKMSYTEFVWFLLAEEDKRHPTSIEYWFRCMDLDGDGYLSMYELEYFYEEQLQRMEQLGIETLPFEDCLCQMLDMIGPKIANMISLSDLRNCPMAPIFFDTFFNLEKYLDHEQRDPFASQRDLDEDGNEMSDWDRFAAEEYELLVAEEGNADGTMDELCYEEDGDSNPEMIMEQALDGNEIMYHSEHPNQSPSVTAPS